MEFRPYAGRQVGLALLVALGASLLIAAPAQATTFTVSSNANSGLGTLRADLASAAPGDTILVPASFTITLASPLTVTQAASGGGVTIAKTGTGSPTISGSNATRIFSMNADTALTLNSLTLTAGNSTGDGGAITAATPVTGSTLTIENSTLTGNSSAGNGGAVFMSAAGGHVATLNVVNSTFSNNTAPTGAGGAIKMFHDDTVNITNSTFTNNVAGSGGGGAIQTNSPEKVNVTGSTFSGNHTSGGNGGALELNGNASNAIAISNSTFTANAAAGFSGGAIQFSSPTKAQLLNVTINGNSAGTGGGINLSSSASNSFTVENSIISGNTATTGANCNFTPFQLMSLGHNLEAGTSCGFTAAGDLNADPMLGTLANNGGPTQTEAIQPPSPAVDAGNAAACPATDQRGVARPDDPGTACDIGAYEFVTPKPPLQAPHNTKISKAKIKKKKHSATFTFSASGTVTGFQCALVKVPKKKGKHHKAGKLVFRSCSSPKTYKHLKHGRYKFEVRAVNATGPDPTPAIKKFKI